MRQPRYTNTVPLGREGTGAATILGPNRALQYFINQGQQRQNELLQGQERFYQNQSRYNSAYQKDLAKLSSLAETPMYQQDFSTLTSELMNQGGQLMSRGYNPYNPTQSDASRQAVSQLNSEINQVRGLKSVVDQLAKQRQEVAKAYSANPGDYDYDEFREFMDFEKNNTLEDVAAGARPTIPSKVVDITSEITKQYPGLYEEYTQFENDEQGNPIRREIRAADEARIGMVVRNELANPNSQYSQEVNRRLRRQFGPDASTAGVLGITDRDQLRAALDAEFRNPSENNPIVELRANGIDARPGTQEYEDFLDRATDEQLRAEMVLEDAAQQMGNAIIGRTNTRDQRRFDFSLRDQQLQEQAAARAARNSDASYRNTLSLIQKRESGDDPVSEAMIDEAVDVDFTRRYGEETRHGIQVWGTIPQSTPAVSINKQTSTDLFSGGTRDVGEVRGSITGVGVVGVDKNGVVIKGDSPEALARDPRVVKFVPKVIVQDSDESSYVYDVSAIPVNSLSKANQENINRSLAIQKKAAADLNEQIKNRSTSSNTTPTSSGKEKISW